MIGTSAVAEFAHAGEVHPEVILGSPLEVERRDGRGGHGTPVSIDAAIPLRERYRRRWLSLTTRQGLRGAGSCERCTSLSTTEPSSAPVIGFSPTVPTTIVSASDLLCDLDQCIRGLRFDQARRDLDVGGLESRRPRVRARSTRPARAPRGSSPSRGLPRRLMLKPKTTTTFASRHFARTIVSCRAASADSEPS